MDADPVSRLQHCFFRSRRFLDPVDSKSLYHVKIDEQREKRREE